MAISAHISVFFEVSCGSWFIHGPHGIHFSDELITLGDVSLIKNFRLMDTVDFMSNFFCLYFSHGVDFDLEQLHPADSSDGVFRQHS